MYEDSLDNRFRDTSFLHAFFVGIIEFFDSCLGFSALLGAILIDIFSEPSDGLEGIAENGSSKHDKCKDQEKNFEQGLSK